MTIALLLHMFAALHTPLGGYLEALGAEDLGVRDAFARAIESATSDPQEQRQLARIARFESSFREDVIGCRKLGAAGELTAWQILPRGMDERRRLCVTLEQDAKLALERIRESTRACRHLPKEERLAVYTRGSCSSVEGRRLSRVRYAP